MTTQSDAATKITKTESRDRRLATDRLISMRARVEEASRERARLMEQVSEQTRVLATLIYEAREAGAGNPDLAQWVVVPDGDGGLRTVTRQAIDQLVTSHFGRENKPKPTASGAPVTEQQTINMSAFE